MAAGNPSFDEIVSSTLKNYRKTLIDNLMDKQALLWVLKKQGFVTEDKGGTSIVVPLMYGLNSTVASYSGYDLIDLTPQAGITSAEFSWKYLAGSVTISGQEEFENSGDKTRIFNLLEAKIRQLETSFRLEVNSQLFADGTGNGGKDITGLALAVEDGASWSTYGGIDSSDSANSWWRNQWFNFDTEFGASSKFLDADGPSYEGLSAFRKMYNDVGVDGEKPDLIVTTQAIVEDYEAALEGKQRIVSTNPELGDAGFRNVEYKKTPIVWDEEMTAEEVLFLNSKYMKFVIGQGRNFTMTPFMKPKDQDAKSATMILACNLVTSKRDVHGRITALSTA